MNKAKILLEGELQKQSPKGFLGIHVWQDRYFVLWSDQLCYYKEKGDVGDEDKILGYLLIDNISHIEHEKKECKFKIVLEGVDRKFKQSTPSVETSQLWVSTLEDLLKKRSKSPTPLASPSDANTKFWKPQVHRTILRHRHAITDTSLEPVLSPKSKVYLKSAEEVGIILGTLSKLKQFDEIARNQQCDQMYERLFESEEVVYKEQQSMSLCYVVVKGSLQSDKVEEVPRVKMSIGDGTTALVQQLQQQCNDDGHLRVGDAFGELAQLYDAPSPSTIQCTKEPVKCFCIERGFYKEILSDCNVRKHNNKMELLKTSKIQSLLDESKRSMIAEIMEDKLFYPGQTVQRPGAPPYMIFLAKGAFTVVDQQVGEIDNAQSAQTVFFETAVLQETNVDVIVSCESLCQGYVLSGKQLRKLHSVYTCLQELVVVSVSKSEQQVLSAVEEEDNATSTQEQMMVIPSFADITNNTLDGNNDNNNTNDNDNVPTLFDLTNAMKSIHIDDTKSEAKEDVQHPTLESKIKLSDLTVLGTLGRGTFGHVQLVRDATNTTYALKAIRQNHVVRLKQTKNILRELEFLRLLHHPFIVSLFGSFYDDKHVYFLLEAVLGGEFFTLLRDRDVLNEKQAQFYTACIAVMLGHLHEQNIVYRDLKPENLLVDKDGYLKLTDFGFAKKIVDRTYTFCGTPEYLAPEIISGEGHGYSVDYWTLGILVYEVQLGYTPFYDEGGLAMMHKRMQSGHIYFPSKMSPEVKEFIEGLLGLKPALRLGAAGGLDQLKQTRWFQHYDWDSLLQRRTPAPIAVTIASNEDISNFQPYEADEEDVRDTGVQKHVDPHNPNWFESF